MHKILIVDDERPARNLLAELITRYIPDAKIIQMESAQDALQYLQTKNVDLMFVDIEMPGMSGLQLLDQLQSAGLGKQPYTFIITAFPKYEYVLGGFRSGILDFIEKPLHNEKIFKAIHLYFNKIKTETIELKVSDGCRRMKVNSILAIKAIGRKKLMVYTSDVILPDVAHSLKELQALLPSNFIYIQRDSVINIWEVKHYNLKMKEINIVSQNKSYSFNVSRNNMIKVVAFLNDK